MLGGVIQGGKDLGEAVKHDLSSIDRYSFINAGKAVLMPAIGASLLSREKFSSYLTREPLFTRDSVIAGTAMLSIGFSIAHPYISFPLAIYGAFAGIYLRQKDETRRAAGENPGFHVYNSLLMPIERAFSIENIRYGSVSIFESIWGPGAAGKWWKIPLTAVGVTAVAAVGGFACYTALGTVAQLAQRHTLGYVASHLSGVVSQLTSAISYIPIVNAFQTWIANCASVVLPAIVPDFIAKASVWLLVPGIASYLYDTYKCHTALPAIENAVSIAKRNALNVEQTLHVKEAIKVLSQYSGPMEQLIASAIVFHDANIDMMGGNGGLYANRHLMEGSAGFIQAIANRGGALTRLLNNLPAPAGGLAAINAITPAQITAAYASITPDQLTTVTAPQIAAAQFPGGAQLAAITAAQISSANLTQAQVNAIGNPRRNAVGLQITPAQRAAVTANQLATAGFPAPADTANNRNKYIAAVIDSMQAIAVASGGVNNMALKNILTSDVNQVLINQNSKDAIATGQNLDQTKLRTLATTIAQTIHANPNHANIQINIDEVVKLVTLADQAVVKSRGRV